MSQGQGNIKYTNPPGAGTGFVNVAGGRNGLSLDSGNFIVLGNDKGASGSPAKLLSDREIDGQARQINFINGNLILSKVAQAGGGERLGVYDVIGAGLTQNTIAIEIDSSAAGAIPTALRIDATVPAPAGITSPGSFLDTRVNGVQVVSFQYNGENVFRDPVSGNAFVGIQSIPTLIGPISGSATINITGNYVGNPPFGLSIEMAMQSNFTCVGGTAGYTGLFIKPFINQSSGGSGAITRVDFEPTITSATGQIIFLNGSIGDVLLQRAGTSGRTGVQGITVPTAWLHIGAGKAAVGSAPIKLVAGVNLTTPEAGTIEFDGTNLFFTIAAARQVLFAGLSGAAAPALTATPAFTSFFGGNTNALGNPNSWASVNISGTVFKIPLYT